MPFDILETSLESGAPIELYEFLLGGTYHRFTTNPRNVTYVTPDVGSVEYTAIPIKRDNIQVDPDKRTEVMRITLPAATSLVRAYINNVPGAGARLRMWRAHRYNTTSDDLQQIFAGDVRSVGFSLAGLTAEILVVPISAALLNSMPRHVFSGVCNHILYGADCTIDKDSFKHTGSVTGLSGDAITVSGLSGLGSGWATAGFVARSNGDYRGIISHVGDVIRIFPLEFADDVTGELLDVFAGCDHGPETCSTKFSNIINFGGYPFVPTVNPFQSGVA